MSPADAREALRELRDAIIRQIDDYLVPVRREQGNLAAATVEHVSYLVSRETSRAVAALAAPAEGSEAGEPHVGIDYAREPDRTVETILCGKCGHVIDVRQARPAPARQEGEALDDEAAHIEARISALDAARPGYIARLAAGLARDPRARATPASAEGDERARGCPTCGSQIRASLMSPCCVSRHDFWHDALLPLTPPERGGRA